MVKFVEGWTRWRSDSDDPSVRSVRGPKRHRLGTLTAASPSSLVPSLQPFQNLCLALLPPGRSRTPLNSARFVAPRRAREEESPEFLASIVRARSSRGLVCKKANQLACFHNHSTWKSIVRTRARENSPTRNFPVRTLRSAETLLSTPS
jgi:hypothetical protein